MLKYRLVSASILIPIVIGTIFLLPSSVFSIVMLSVCILAAWEWGKLVGFASKFECVWLTTSYSLLLFIILFVMSGTYYYNIYQWMVTNLLWSSMGWWFFAFFLVLFYPRSATIWRYSRTLRFIFGLLTIVPFFFGILTLHTWHYEKSKYDGTLWLFYIITLVWASDSSSYIFGKLFGTYKLAPKISPNKTWQGFIGGLITTIIISWSYSFLVKLDIEPFTLLICSFIATLAAVLGDLTESMFKREAGIKDSGHIIPGHGGILDCIDSLMAAIPVFTCLLFFIFNRI